MASCAGISAPLVVQVVKEAMKNLVPVKVGAGTGHEDRISENRRLKLKDGSEVDMRRAYAMPPDEDVAGVGPIDSADRAAASGSDGRHASGRALQLRLPSHHEPAQQGQLGGFPGLRVEADRGGARGRG